MSEQDKKQQNEKKPADFWRAYGRAAGVLGIGWALAAGAVIYAVTIHDKDMPTHAQQEKGAQTPPVIKPPQ